MTITREQVQKIIEAADEVITALAGTNEDVHPDNSTKMCAAWDNLNDRHATPEVVRELARIALASLEAEPVAYIIQDKYERDRGTDGHLSRSHASKYVSPEDINEHEIICTALFKAPPLAYSVPDEWTFQNTQRYREDTGRQDAWSAMWGWNACRAAMQGKAEPVTTDCKLPEEKGSSLQLRNLIRQRHAEWSQATFGDVGPIGPLKHLSKEAMEAVAEPYDLSEWADMQFLLWDAQRRAGISDAEITAAMEEKLKVNMAREWPQPKDGEPRLHIKEPDNSPVIQDGWVACSERMPDKLIPVNVMYADGEMWSAMWTGTKWDDGTEFPDLHPVTHWQEMPAAPQQE